MNHHSGQECCNSVISFTLLHGWHVQKQPKNVMVVQNVVGHSRARAPPTCFDAWCQKEIHFTLFPNHCRLYQNHCHWTEWEKEKGFAMVSLDLTHAAWCRWVDLHPHRPRLDNDIQFSWRPNERLDPLEMIALIHHHVVCILLWRVAIIPYHRSLGSSMPWRSIPTLLPKLPMIISVCCNIPDTPICLYYNSLTREHMTGEIWTWRQRQPSSAWRHCDTTLCCVLPLESSPNAQMEAKRHSTTCRPAVLTSMSFLTMITISVAPHFSWRIITFAGIWRIQKGGNGIIIMIHRLQHYPWARVLARLNHRLYSCPSADDVGITTVAMTGASADDEWTDPDQVYVQCTRR